MQSLKNSHWKALFYTWNYVLYTGGHGIALQGTDHLTLRAYSDSAWEACPDNRRSISGYLLFLGMSLNISWKSKKQYTVF